MKTWSPCIVLLLRCWGVFLLISSSRPWSCQLHLLAAQEDGNEKGLDHAEDEMDDDDEEEEEEAHQNYDPLFEGVLNTCRRNPRWWRPAGAGDGNNTAVVDYYAGCQKLTGWNPRDSWWRVLGAQPIKEVLTDETEAAIAECFDAAFLSVPTTETFWWAACNESDRTEACYVDEPFVTAHYAHLEEGDIVTIRNVLSEQEAYGVEVLVKCMKDHLPDGMPFFEQRGEGDEANRGTLLTGMMQKYLPGVAASITAAAQDAYAQSDWSDLELPAPIELGIRSAQLLEYRKTGRLGLQYDRDSLFTVSVALSDDDDCIGGYFTLQSDHALFKVARRSAIVFFSETSNSITPVTGGVRKSLEVEFWEDDDVPLGKIRPSTREFEAYRLARLEALGVDSVEQMTDAGGGSDEL